MRSAANVPETEGVFAMDNQKTIASFENILDRVDADGIAEFTAADWAVLALAALDQAGVTPRNLKRALAENARHTANWGDVLDSLEVES